MIIVTLAMNMIVFCIINVITKILLLLLVLVLLSLLLLRRR